jgi:hypothetical protein
VQDVAVANPRLAGLSRRIPNGVIAIQNPSAPEQQWISFAVSAVVIGIVLFFRIRRMSKDRPLKLERLWILPALYAVFMVVMYWFFPPAGMTWLYCILALGLGATAGWWRGRMMRITVDPASHALNHRPSPAAVLFIFALVAIRAGARQLAATGEASLHLDAMAITDVLSAFALGLLATQRLEMFLRARRLLAEARAAR